MGYGQKCFKNTGIKHRETELLDQRMSFQKKKFLAHVLPYCTAEKPNHLSCPPIVYEPPISLHSHQNRNVILLNLC